MLLIQQKRRKVFLAQNHLMTNQKTGKVNPLEVMEHLIFVYMRSNLAMERIASEVKCWVMDDVFRHRKRVKDQMAIGREIFFVTRKHREKIHHLDPFQHLNMKFKLLIKPKQKMSYVFSNTEINTVVEPITFAITVAASASKTSSGCSCSSPFQNFLISTFGKCP